MAAKQHGIRVVPIDYSYGYEKDSNKTSYEGGTEQRCLMINYVAAKQFNENPPKGKYVFFVGYTHINTRGKAPGIAQITGAPSVVVEDCAQFNVSLNAKHPAKPDVLIQLNGKKTKINATISDAIEKQQIKMQVKPPMADKTSTKGPKGFFSRRRSRRRLTNVEPRKSDHMAIPTS
jgi:hypothetical protein